MVAATDYIKLYADQVRFLLEDRRYRVLGTDGFGRSDTRSALRRFFEVDRQFIALAALHELAAEGSVDQTVVGKAVERFGISAQKPDPTKV